MTEDDRPLIDQLQEATFGNATPMHERGDEKLGKIIKTYEVLK